MFKKILLILSALIFAISCSNPSNPNGNNNTGDGGNNGNNTGNGGNTETGTTDPSKIAAFLQDKTGVYYYKNENGEFLYNDLKVKDSKLYETYPGAGMWELIDNNTKIKLIEESKTIVLENTGYVTEYTFNGNDNKMYFYYVLTKQAYTAPAPNLNNLGTIADFAKYSGDYYVDQMLYLQIDNEGNIYHINSGYTASKDNNTLVLKSIREGYTTTINFENDNLIAEQPNQNGEVYKKLYKTDLAENYKGTYIDSATKTEVLSIDEEGNISFLEYNNTLKKVTEQTILEGNLLTRTQIYNNDTPNEKREITTVRFGDTVEYKDYNNVTKTLIKQ